jgi:acetyltransferase
MSAARAAARAKPVIVIKAGRHSQGAKAATHTGALAGSDAVYDAAFRRAGLLRVYDLDAALMIGHHFSISAFCKVASASGVCWLGGKIS